jgi:predicted ABC-type ATPase
LTAPPILIVFAGPNGSGKSTLAGRMRTRDPLFPSLHINADDIAKERTMSSLDAAIEADRQRNEAIRNKQSFATETVMSTGGKIDFMKHAKAAGYEVTLVYITTQDDKINLGRVEARVATGGHDVPPEKTVTRYKKSMALLAGALAVADIASIFNNSFENPILIAQKTSDGQIALRPQPRPSIWTEENIMELLGLSGPSI